MKNVLLIALVLVLGSCSAHAQKSKVMVERNGKVGIGTNQPDELLTVKGIIHTREVKVDMKGALAPDYVFENYFDGQSELLPDYKMMDLAELRIFLAENKHLPGVPSAESLSKEGLHLKEMNLKLLEKIEELTLYTLEQQTIIDQLSQRLDQIEKNQN